VADSGKLGARQLARQVHVLGRMFGFYSNRLGCIGSIIVSVIGTIVLVIVMQSCSRL
jgi:uncharacterized membrane protein YeaQ/YmgE (transglycosylase-associated protein family)